MAPLQILVADDDVMVLTNISNGLKEAGYDVLSVQDGESAVEAGCQHNPDLALLDIRMPGISGIAAARELREKAGINSIFLSAHSEEDVVELASKEGALGYLVKPVNAQQLLPTIKAALERSAEIKRLQQNEANLTDAMKRSRQISMAIGIYMERYHTGEDEAFMALREFARAEQRKLADIAKDLVQATEDKNTLIGRIRQHDSSIKNK